MRFNCGPSFGERFEARHLRLQEWHWWFAWRPRRVAPGDCRWLEWIERKGTFHDYDFHGYSWSWIYRTT